MAPGRRFCAFLYPDPDPRCSRSIPLLALPTYRPRAGNLPLIVPLAARPKEIQSGFTVAQIGATRCRPDRFAPAGQVLPARCPSGAWAFRAQEE